MVQKSRKRSLITAISILVVLLVVIGIVALMSSLNKKDDPYVQSQSTDTTNIPTEDVEDETPPSDEVDPVETDVETVDPATVSTIDIAPLSITVSYVKGIGAFEYEVLRAPNGTRYVEFRSTNIIGTKCTNDAGTFASIIVSPTDSESATLSKKTTVDDTTYGLSLADATCTTDTEKLEQYQKSFSDGFSLLKKIE